jgi:hypothetical protein
MGSNSTGAENVAVGESALQSNASGERNTALGTTSLNNNTGNYNTGVGYKTLTTNQTGSNNTAVGYQADVLSSNLTNATAIGSNTVVNASNKVRIGDANVTVIEGQVDFTFPSDSTKKENYLAVNEEEILSKIGKLNLQSCNYKGHYPVKFRHYGPTAQEFFSAFGNDGFGTIGSDTTLCGSDVSGINMIGIKALEKRTAELIVANKKMNELASSVAKLLKIINQQQVELSALKNEVSELKILTNEMHQMKVIMQNLNTVQQEDSQAPLASSE